MTVSYFFKMFIKAVGFRNKYRFFKYGLRNTLNKFVGYTYHKEDMFIQFKELSVYFAPLKSELSSYIEIYLNRSYEIEKDFIAKENDIVFDVGANIGFYTVLQGMRAKRGEVFSFEPNPDAFCRLTKNIKINNLNNVKLFNKALWRKEGRLFLKELNVSTTSSKCFPLPSDGLREVQSTTLDNVLEKYGISRIDIMKIDVEGSEVEVIRGGMKALDYTRKIVMECHAESLKEEVERLLSSKGFKKVREVKRDKNLFLLFFKK